MENLIFGKVVFKRFIKTAETELFELYECYLPKKRKPEGSFVKPKWIATNKLLLLTQSDCDVREYFKIITYEKQEAGREYLKKRFYNYYKIELSTIPENNL